MKKNILLLALMVLILVMVAACSQAPAPAPAPAPEPSAPAASEPAEATPAEDEYADWPNKNITIVCHTESGAVDTMMRQLGAALEPILGVSVLIENRAGGDGAVAMSYVLNQPKDGYTFMSSTGSFTFAFGKGEIDYTPEDFTWITTLNGEASAIAVLADSPLMTMEDFIAAMQTDPGKYIIGGYGSAAFNQYVMYSLEQLAGFKANAWIPYSSGGDVPLQLLGGHIDIGFMTPSSSVNQVQSGEIRLLAVSTEERSPYFPDVPTFKECGYDFADILWRGIIVAKGTPQPIIDKMYAAIQEATASQQWQDYLTKNLQDPSAISGDEFYNKVLNEVGSRTEFLAYLKTQ